MAPRLAPWTTAMLDMLERADGWVPVIEVIAVGMAAVPPGRAIQERQRLAAKARTTGSGHRPDRTDDQLIRTGARGLTRQALDGMVRRGRAERHHDLIRLAPTEDQ